MKRIIVTTALLLAATPLTLLAQDQPKKEKKSEEIIIRKDGDKEMTLKVEVNGDKVTINGKPLSEFKDENVTINKRKVIIKKRGNGDNRTMEVTVDGAPGQNFGMIAPNMEDFEMEDAKPSAFLGVTSTVIAVQNEDKPAKKGAEITAVTPESAAEKAGLKPGDVITKINDKVVEDPAGLSEVVTSFKPKEEVTIYYTREGKEKKAKATLGERKQSSVRAFSFKGNDAGREFNFTTPRGNHQDENVFFNFDGEGLSKLKELSNLDFDMDGDFKNLNMFPRQKKLGIKIQDTEDGDNVKVIAVEDSSAAAIAGIQKDDLIVEIDGAKITNTDEAREHLAPDDKKKSYKMKVIRNKQELNIEVKIQRKLKTANL